MTEEESKVSKSVNQSFLKEFGKFECPECSEFFVNYNENIPYLQRILNEDFHEKKKQFKRIMSPVDNNNCYTAGKI